MGTIVCRHARDIAGNVEHVLAVKMLRVSLEIDFWSFTFGKGTKSAHDKICGYITFMEEDRAICKDMKNTRKLINSGEIVKVVFEAVELI